MTEVIVKAVLQSMGSNDDEPVNFRQQIRAAHLHERNPIAQLMLGDMYLAGEGCTKNEPKAFQIISNSAKTGNSAAQYKLGKLLYKGTGCTQNQLAAKEMYQKSADQGYPLALNKLASWHAKGKGCAKDDKKAIELYSKSAQQGNPVALYILGTKHQKGIGCPKDKIKAFEMFKKSASLDNPNAQFSLARIYEKGKLCDKDFKQAFDLYSKAAPLGHSKSQFRLALCYRNGRGCEVSIPQYKQWSQKASASAVLERSKGKNGASSTIMTPDEIIAELNNAEEQQIDDILAGAAKLLMWCGKENVTAQDLSAAKVFYEIALTEGNTTLLARDQEKLQIAINRIDTIQRTQETNELLKEKEELEKMKQGFETELLRIADKEEGIKDEAQQFVERTKRWANTSSVARELFISALTSP